MRISDWSSDVCSSDLLQVNRLLERGAYIFQFVDHDAFGAHGFGDSGEALVVELSGDEAAIVEINLVFLFRAPLAIVEDHRGNRNIVAYAGHGFHQADRKSTRLNSSH